MSAIARETYALNASASGIGSVVLELIESLHV